MDEMAGPIKVDLEDTMECKAIKMIRFLFAFCMSNRNGGVLVCDEQLLARAFKRVKAIAKRGDTFLADQLSDL